MNNPNITEEVINTIINEIFDEKHISPMLDKKSFYNSLKAGVQELDTLVGKYIDYDEDRKARELLKLYVLYDSKNLLHEFKKDYVAEYVDLQIRYHTDTDL